MAEFEVRAAKLRHCAGDQQKTAAQLDKLASQVRNCCSTLKLSMTTAGSDEIQRKLMSLSNELKQQSEHIKKMSRTMEEISSMYSVTENQIAGIKVSHSRIEKAKDIAVDHGDRDEEKHGFDYYTDMISKIIQNFNLDQDASAGLAAELFSLLQAGYLMFGSENRSDLYNYVTKFTGAIMKTGSAGYDLIMKFGEKKVRDFLSKYGALAGLAGAYGGVIGFSSEFLINYAESGGSWSEFLKNSGSMVYEGSTAVEGMMKYFGKSVTKRSMAAVNCIICMLSTAAGSAAEISADGKVTSDEVAGGLLETSISGMNGMLGAFTFDLVQLDADETFDIFKKNAEAAGEMLGRFNLPDGVLVVASGVTAPFVAVWSVPEVIGNWFDDLGDIFG